MSIKKMLVRIKGLAGAPQSLADLRTGYKGVLKTHEDHANNVYNGLIRNPTPAMVPTPKSNRRNNTKSAEGTK